MKLKATVVFFSSIAGLCAATLSYANECALPLEAMRNPRTGAAFSANEIFNSNPNVAEEYRYRYIVGQFNTADERGYCTGVTEILPSAEEMPDFALLTKFARAAGMGLTSLASADLGAVAGRNHETSDIYRANPGRLSEEQRDLRNFQAQVERYRTQAITKPPVYNGYCVGQTVSICELRNGKPVQIARFIASSGKYFPPSRSYYPEMNYINTRRWSSDRAYGIEDDARDRKMGSGSNVAILFQGRWEMPNFLNFLPSPGFAGETQNGIHEIAGGLDSGGTFGAPVSLGCIRLLDFESKLIRWWIPMSAKFFIHFDAHRYRQRGNPADNRAL